MKYLIIKCMGLYNFMNLNFIEISEDTLLRWKLLNETTTKPNS
jgi:hypothetical protein